MNGNKIKHDDYGNIDWDRTQRVHRAQPVSAPALDIEFFKKPTPNPIRAALVVPISTGRPTAAVVSAPRHVKIAIATRADVSLRLVVRVTRKRLRGIARLPLGTG
jgi:hypothetical protein